MYNIDKDMLYLKSLSLMMDNITPEDSDESIIRVNGNTTFDFHFEKDPIDFILEVKVTKNMISIENKHTKNTLVISPEIEYKTLKSKFN